MTTKFKRRVSSFESLVEGGANALVLLALAAAAVVCFTYQILSLSHRYPLDYGEAPLVDQAMHMVKGDSIYRADISTPPYTISNYPPLYVVSLAPFVKLFGPSFFAGRAISILCAWASALFIGLIVYQATPTRDRFAGIVGGLVFLTFPFVVSWSSLARVDLLALALSLAGLCVLIRQPITRRRLIAGAALLTAAIFTRQSYALAAPLAAFVWVLASEDGRGWRKAFALAGWVAGLCAALFLALNSITPGGFYFNIVTANVNEWSSDRLSWNLNRLTGTAAILLIIGVVSIALGAQRNRLWPLVAPYLVGAMLSALTVGKIGSNVNYFLELCAALSLAAGSVIAWSRTLGKPPMLRVALAVFLTIQTVSMLQDTLQVDMPQLQARRAAIDDLKKLERIVAEASSNGSVLADEYMGVLTLQGKPLTIQPFEITQLANAGMWDQKPLLEGIDNKAYPLILIHYFPEFPVYRERWTPQMLDAINRSYRLTEMLANTGVYQPVGVGAREASLVSSAPTRCKGAPWQLPSDARYGMRWDQDGALLFFGRGNAGKVPVHAVAEGLLTRFDGWNDRVAIQHDDPLNPGQKVWTIYGDMASANGFDSFVAKDFPPGVKDVRVKAGQLLGYQGTYSGQSMPMWMHATFTVVRATRAGDLPQTWPPGMVVNPTPYLGLAIEPPKQEPNTQTLACAEK